MSYLNQHRPTLGTVGGKPMSAKSEKDLYQDALAALLREEDNKYCADCEAKSPRWASWNIGVFICIRCAGIHRKLGVHISRVKSVNLDSWTLDQVAGIAAVGNTLARAAYEANLPNGFRRPNSDAGMEQFIKAKYEERRYLIADFKAPRPDPSAVSSLIKSASAANQQPQQPHAQQQPSRLVLPRPPPAASSATIAATPATAQQTQAPPPPPQQPQHPQPSQPDLLLIGEEVPASHRGPVAVSPDSEFGCFAASAAPTAGQQHPGVNPDLIFDETAAGWPAAVAPKKSAKDSIMALYGAQAQQQPQLQQAPFYQQLQQPAGGMHYSASSPILTVGQPQHQQFYQVQQQPQHQQHPGFYSQSAGALIHSAGLQNHQQQQQYSPAGFPYPLQQQQQHAAAYYPPYTQHAATGAAPVSSGGNQVAYLQQIQSQMAGLGVSGARAQQQQQQAASNDFPADIWK